MANIRDIPDNEEYLGKYDANGKDFILKVKENGQTKFVYFSLYSFYNKDLYWEVNKKWKIWKIR